MSELTAKIEKYIRQLAPHQQEREAAQLLIAAKEELSAMQKMLNDKLLAEAKSNAMPEGRKLLSARYVYSVLQQYYLDNRSARIDICSNDVYLILRAALSVAPQPETDRGSNE